MIAVIFLDLAVGELLFAALILFAAGNRALGFYKGRLKGIVENVFWLSVASACAVALIWHAWAQLRQIH
jgi:hypothetical protein